MNDKIKTPIVDKNGKATHVHKKSDSGVTTDRVSSLPAVVAFQEEYVMPEQSTYQEMLEKTKAIHPDAKLGLDDYGQWIITIETGIEEKRELPERFNGTPAREAFDRYEDGGDGLSAWAMNGHTSRYAPLEIIAEYYNLSRERYGYNREWFDEEMKKVGGRSWSEIFALKKASSDSLTEEEKSVFAKYEGGSGKEPNAYSYEKLKDRYQAIETAGF